MQIITQGQMIGLSKEQVITDAMQPIQALTAATQKGGVSPKTLSLVHLR
jgi:hypothetical protein